MVIMVSSGTPESDSTLQFMALKVDHIHIYRVLLMLHLEVIDQASNDGRLSHLRGNRFSFSFRKFTEPIPDLKSRRGLDWCPSWLNLPFGVLWRRQQAVQFSRFWWFDRIQANVEFVDICLVFYGNPSLTRIVIRSSPTFMRFNL